MKKVSQIRASQIRASQIRATQMKATQIRETEISSNHRELHGAIFWQTLVRQKNVFNLRTFQQSRSRKLVLFVCLIWRGKRFLQPCSAGVKSMEETSQEAASKFNTIHAACRLSSLTKFSHLVILKECSAMCWSHLIPLRLETLTFPHWAGKTTDKVSVRCNIQLPMFTEQSRHESGIPGWEDNSVLFLHEEQKQSGFCQRNNVLLHKKKFDCFNTRYRSRIKELSHSSSGRKILPSLRYEIESKGRTARRQFDVLLPLPRSISSVSSSANMVRNHT